MTPELRLALNDALPARTGTIIAAIAPIIDAAIAEAVLRNLSSARPLEHRDAMLNAADDMSEEAALSYLNGRLGTSGAQYDFATWLRNRANGGNPQ